MAKPVAFGTNRNLELAAGNFVRVAEPDTESGVGNDDADIVGDEHAVDGAASGDGDTDSIDPDTLNGNSGDSDAPYGYTASGRVRKRPVGSGSRRTTSTSERGSASQASKDIKEILFSIHMMGSIFLKVPQLVLSEEEAEKLGKAINRVSELYEIPLMDEKSRAWINLGVVAASVYGPRIGSVMIDRKVAKQPRQQNGTVPFPNVASM